MRSVLLVAHTSRHRIRDLATESSQRLVAAGFEVWMLPEEAAACTDDDRGPDRRPACRCSA
jgi:hypothetical protein